MVKIVTVHGTNAGAKEDAGEQWWQLGSDFQGKLAERVADRIEFDPFHWSGENSERARRTAGAKLAAKLLRETDPVVVIGHSHGGSVALHALFLIAKKSPAKALAAFRSLITVGTPMIRYSGARNPIFRFNIIGQLFLLYAILIGGLSTSAVVLGDTIGDLSPLIGQSVFAGFMELDDSLFGRIAQVVTPAILTTTVLPLVILSQFTRRSATRNRTFASNRLWGEFKGLYAALNHTQDEAIAALKTGAKLDLTIADRRTVQTAIFVPLALLMAGILGMRTVSEIVDIEGLRTLVLPDVEAEIVDRSGFATLGLRDAGSEIRSLSGEVRTDSSDLTGLLRRNVVFLRDDYVVLDVATAVRAGAKENLVAYIENLRPTEVSTVVNFDDGRVCSRDAVYLTAAGQARLAELARGLPEAAPAIADGGIVAASMSRGESRAGDASGSKIDSPLARRASRPAFTMIEDIADGGGELTQQEAVVARAVNAQERRCRAEDVVVADGSSAMEALIETDAFIEVAAEALYSSRPELIEASASMKGGADATERSDFAFAPFLVYPELRRGEAIVFERSTFNDAQVACFAGLVLRQAERFSLGLFEKPRRLRSLSGLCAQMEGQKFTFYDGATTLLSEVEHHLENGVVFLGAQVDRLREDTGRTDYIVDATDYLEIESVQAGILSPFYFVTSVLAVAWLIAWGLSFILAPVLSGIFNQLIRQNIFGNDGHGEKVEQVAPGLDFSAEQVGTLPEKVEREVDEYVLQFTTITVERLRDLISLHALEPKGSTVLPQLAETLTWKELIHTAYFDVDGFIDHVADVLAQKAGLARADVAPRRRLDAPAPRLAGPGSTGPRPRAAPVLSAIERPVAGAIEPPVEAATASPLALRARKANSPAFVART